MPSSRPLKDTLPSEAALRTLQSQGRYLFLAAEFAQLTGRDDQVSATRLALARLARKGRVVSLVRRPSTWLIVPPEQQSYGAPPVTWWLDDFLRGTEPGYYLALLSAARYWGSAHYARQASQVMVARPRRRVRVGTLEIEFSRRNGVARTPVVVAADGVAAYRVSTREATLLDLVRHPKEVGGLEAILRIARDLGPKMTSQGIAQALDAQNQTAAAQRLGFVLSHVSTKLAAPVARWLVGHRLRPQPLEPGVAQPGDALRYQPEWCIEFTLRQAAMLQEFA